MTGGASLSGSQPSAEFNQATLAPGFYISTQELCNKAKLTKSATLSLLTDTKWPGQSNEAVQTLLRIFNYLPDLPVDLSEAPVKDTVVEFIHVLEAVYASVKTMSDEYGKRERGFKEGIKYKLSLLRGGRCADTLRTCRDEMDKASANLHNCLNHIPTSGHTSGVRLKGSEMPPELQSRVTMPIIEVNCRLNSLEPQGLETKPAEQTTASEHAKNHPISQPDLPPGLAGDQQDSSPIRDGALITARKTFKTIEVVSGAIPIVGNFVGGAAKVGLAFVNMIEAMSKNEDISKELASHISQLSSRLEYFKQKLSPEKEDEVTAQIEGLHKEIECVQMKVNRWNSSGRLKKALLSSDFAEELRGHQDAVQTALEEMQARLLASLKTADLVIELTNTELRAEQNRLLDRLGDGCYGARGNAIEDVVCLPGTRVQLLNRINEWVKDSSPSADRVFWIRGMAGRGKSTIASTVAQNWASKGSCAIFHFRRGQNALDGQFVCALARQLGKGLISEVKYAILDCVRENEDIAKERLDQQFKTLFVGSLQKLQNHAHPILIIVDALDECRTVADAVRFVRLIDRHSSFFPPVVKFLLTCRPEAPLIAALEPRKWHVEDLDSIHQVSEDIARFIRHAFNQIRNDHDLPNSWPSQTDLESLVKMSQGLFQWARTAIAYIGNGSPSHRLRELLQHSSNWTGLDDLYHQILSRAFEKAEENSVRKQMLSWVLGAVVVSPYPVTPEIIAFLHDDHEIFRGQQNIVPFLCTDILADLNSLLYIPPSPFEPVRLMHTSIRDLLTAPERCQNRQYFVNVIRNHQRLASVSLHIMGRDLKQNICNLRGIPNANSEIQESIDNHISKGLRYCCRSWATHLTAGVSWSEATVDTTSILLAQFQKICDHNLLPWLEVMSFTGDMAEAYTIAKQVHQWLLGQPRDISNGTDIALWNDTQRFIATFFKLISFSALDIYASALPRCPVETTLWLKYRSRSTSWIMVGERHQNWSQNIWTASLHSPITGLSFSSDGSFLMSGLEDGTVQFWDAKTGSPLGDPLTSPGGSTRSVVLSPDGKALAAGSYDGTVWLWDAQPGTMLGIPLTGHSKSIRSVIFSPNSKILASGSGDGTIRLWDVQAGVSLGGPLTGHSHFVESVAFSPDNKVLASGSCDGTIRLWNTQTGEPLAHGLLAGHRDGVKSVVFSPDGHVLASGSHDRTVRLWNAQTGVLLGDPLTGYDDLVSSVAFSIDGMVMASGSRNGTIKLWDVQTRTPLGNPLTGHGRSTMSVLFSPDGKALVSGSYDKTIRMWDVQTGAGSGDILTGHNSSITSVVISPNGKLLASGSADETVRLWDAQTGVPLGDPLIGHSGGVTSVAFSPDSKVLASGSYDQTVRLWDAQTGGSLGGPLIGHRNSVRSVVFSSDSKVLASGSYDQTIRLWDSKTGAILGDSLIGHTYSVESVAFSPDGRVLASGSYDRTVRLWDVRRGTLLGAPLVGHSMWVVSVAFSPDGNVLASGSCDGTVRLWDVRTGAPLGDPLTGHSKPIMSVAFSPDGKVLASGSYDKTVLLWNAQTRTPFGDPLTDHSDSITSIVFYPNGKVVASVSLDGIIRFWDPLTSQMRHVF